MKILTRSSIKSTVALLLSCVSIGVSQHVSAKENIESENNFAINSNVNKDLSSLVVNYKVPDKVLKKDMEQQAAAIIEENSRTRTPNYVNITYKIDGTTYPSAKGYVGNQPSHGTRIKNSSGGFFWSTSGGPSISVGSGFPGFSFSISLGTVGPSGVWVKAPNTRDYFKVYAQKTYKAERLAFYGHPINHQSGPKQFLYYGYRKHWYSQTAWAVAQ